MNSVSTLSIAIASSSPSVVTATIGVSTGPPQPFATILAPFDIAASATPRQPAAAIGKPLPPVDPGEDAPSASVLPMRETDAAFAIVAGPLTASDPSGITPPHDQDARSTADRDREDRRSRRDKDFGEPLAYSFAAPSAPQPIAPPVAPTFLAAPPVSHGPVPVRTADPAAIPAASVLVASADAPRATARTEFIPAPKIADANPPAIVSSISAAPQRPRPEASPVVSETGLVTIGLAISAAAQPDVALAVAPQAPAPGIAPVWPTTIARPEARTVAHASGSTVTAVTRAPFPPEPRQSVTPAAAKTAFRHDADADFLAPRSEMPASIGRSIAVPAQRQAEAEVLPASLFAPSTVRVFAGTPSVQPDALAVAAQAPESNALPMNGPGESRNKEGGSIMSNPIPALPGARLPTEPRIVAETDVGPPLAAPVAPADPSARTSPAIFRREAMTSADARAPEAGPIPNLSRPVVTSGAIAAQSVAEAVATPSPTTFAFTRQVEAQPTIAEPAWASSAAAPFAKAGVTTPLRPEAQPIAPPAQPIAAAPTREAGPITTAMTRPARLTGPTPKHNHADLAISEPTPARMAQPFATTAAILPEAQLDMGRHGWPQAMIARIEALRDAADAVDTNIRVIPDKLGAIDVSVRRDGDVTHVHFNAEQAQTRTILADAQPRLAELADARGLKLGQSSVDGGGQHPQQHNRPQPAAFVSAAPVRARRDEATTDHRIA